MAVDASGAGERSSSRGARLTRSPRTGEERPGQGRIKAKRSPKQSGRTCSESGRVVRHGRALVFILQPIQSSHTGNVRAALEDEQHQVVLRTQDASACLVVLQITDHPCPEP